MKILVTGGAGFIGSHVVERLVEEGHEVHVLDSLLTGKQEYVPENVHLHALDIRDERVSDLFKDEQFEVLVHHAAQLDVRRSVQAPAYDADINVVGFLNCMEAGRKHNLKKVVFASTGGAIYGEPDYVPQDESHPLRPISPYGITKLTTEHYLFFYYKTYGIVPVILRYANVYGPRQRFDGEGGVVAIFIKKMMTGENPIIFGDGEQTRDYVYVGDVAEANILALDRELPGTYNIGTGIETTVNRLVEELQNQDVPKCTPQYEPGRAGEQKRSVLAATHAQKELGWIPQKTLSEGLKHTLNWFKSRASELM